MRSAERHGEQGASRAVHRRLAHIFTAMLAATIILQVAAGAFYGSLAAELRIWQARRAVTGECRDCFNYLLKDRHVRGIPISADKDRVAVLISPEKVVLLMWAEVYEITDARVRDGAQVGQRLTQP